MTARHSEVLISVFRARGRNVLKPFLGAQHGCFWLNFEGISRICNLRPNIYWFLRTVFVRKRLRQQLYPAWKKSPKLSESDIIDLRAVYALEASCWAEGACWCDWCCRVEMRTCIDDLSPSQKGFDGFVTHSLKLLIFHIRTINLVLSTFFGALRRCPKMKARFERPFMIFAS